MKGRQLHVLLSLMFLLFLICAPTKPVAAESNDKTAILRPQELEKGMKGYGLTVFGGKRVERFEVEVLGVLNRRGPKRDLILIRASGGILEKSGVIAGMSGSPIYIDDKLIGALAYAWGFSKEAIAGVQPIEAMYALRDRPEPDKRAARGRQAIQKGSPTIELAKSEFMPSSSLAPVQTPVFMDGFTPAMSKELHTFFKSHGLLPITGSDALSTGGSRSTVGGAAAGTNTKRKPSVSPKRGDYTDIVPGQAVAACLVRGDMSISAVGTLTHRKDDTILAFGHPFFNLGNVSLPLCRADVQTVLPSVALSFKMANTLDPIGTVTRDGETAIVGRLGQRAPMAQVSLAFHLPGRTAALDYEFEVAQHELLTPVMIRAAVTSALQTELKAIGPATLDVATKIQLHGYEPIETKNTFTTRLFPATAISGGLTPLFSLLGSSIEEVTLDKVSIEVTVVEELRSAAIDSLRWMSDRYHPGDELRGAVILRPWQKELTYRTFAFRLPEDLPEGKLTIVVAAGREHVQMQQKRDPGRFRPKSIDQLATVYEELPPFTDLVVSYSYGRPGARLADETMPQLPPSLLTIVDASHGLRFEKLQDEKSHSVSTPWVTEGKASFTIEITRDETARRTK